MPVPKVVPTSRSALRVWAMLLFAMLDLVSVSSQAREIWFSPQSGTGTATSDHLAFLEETAQFVALVRENYPQFVVGDIEGHPSSDKEQLMAFWDGLGARLKNMGVRNIDYVRLGREPDVVVFPPVGTPALSTHAIRPNQALDRAAPLCPGRMPGELRTRTTARMMTSAPECYVIGPGGRSSVEG